MEKGEVAAQDKSEEEYPQDNQQENPQQGQDQHPQHQSRESQVQQTQVEKLKQSGLSKSSRGVQGHQEKRPPNAGEFQLGQSTVTKGQSPKKDLEVWKAYDFLFPGGKLSKLIKITNIYKKNLPVGDMLTKFKYTDAFPVINIIGGMENNRGKFYAGVVRAAFNTDAVVLTNGIATGMEKFALRRGVKMIGIAPQKQVKFPKINPTFIQKMELANGHTHLFLVNNLQKELEWGGEVQFKMEVARKLAEGKKKDQPNCKVVCILVADALFDELEEVKLAVQSGYPIIVIPGSPLCDQLIKNSSDPHNSTYSNQQMKGLISKGKFFYCNSTSSEDIAQLTHLLLVIRPW